MDAFTQFELDHLETYFVADAYPALVLERLLATAAYLVAVRKRR